MIPGTAKRLSGSLPLPLRQAGFDLLEAVYGWRDSARLRRAAPKLLQFPRVAAKYERDLARPYDEYVSAVSRSDMAISLRLAAFARFVCDVYRPRKLLDLGSGFSSFVLRTYASTSGTNASVWSVDDSPEWLEKTKAFLELHGLSSSQVVEWDRFDARREAPFDMILHDLGDMDTRMATLEQVLSTAHSHSVILLDDLHKHPYASYARRLLKALGFQAFSLRRYTLDEIGRYSMLVLG